MKRLPIAFALGLGLLTCTMSCGSSTTETPEFVRPSNLMTETIQERISKMESQSGDALLSNMGWIANQGEVAIPYLIDALDHRVPKVRANAAWCLGTIANVKVIPYLQKHANDPNETVRFEVARQLLFLGDHSHIGQLIAGLDSENQRVRFYACNALKSQTGQDFGYDHRVGDAQARSDAVDRWKDWWSEQKQSDWYRNSRPASPGK